MAIHCQLLITTILYSLAFITSLVGIATVGVAKSSFGGYCYLFVKFQTFIVTDDPPSIPCSLNLYANGAVSIYALIMAIYHGYGAFVASKENHIGRTMWVMPWLLLNALATLLIFICACVYSIGFYVTCDRAIYATSSKGKRSCYEALNLITWLKGSSFTSSTYQNMCTSEVAEWINVLFWGGLIVLEAIRLFRNRKARTRQSYADPTTRDTVKIAEIPSSA